MYFYEYIDKEIPYWKNSLITEYVEMVREAFMNYHNRKKEIELLKDMDEKKPNDIYKKMIKERELKLETYKNNLKTVTEYAKAQQKVEKTVYDKAEEALKRIKSFRKEFETTSQEIDEDYKKTEGKGKSL